MESNVEKEIFLDTGEKMYTPRQKQQEILDRAMEHINSVPYGVTARWLFYRLLQDGIYTTKEDYKDRFLPLTAKARKAFLDGWNPYTLADDTRELIPGGDGYESAEDWLEAIQDFEICNLNKWYVQDYYVEIWFEAAAMVGQFRYYTQEMPLVPFQGDCSIPFKWQTAKRLERADSEYEKPIVVLYFGDDDPKGHEIPKSALADIEEWCRVDFDLIRCGLNPGDGPRLGIPDNPEKPGTYQWEALSDTQAREIITSSVEQYYDMNKLSEIKLRERSITNKFREAFQSLVDEWDE